MGFLLVSGLVTDDGGMCPGIWQRGGLLKVAASLRWGPRGSLEHSVPGLDKGNRHGPGKQPQLLA